MISVPSILYRKANKKAYPANGQTFPGEKSDRLQNKLNLCALMIPQALWFVNCPFHKGQLLYLWIYMRVISGSPSPCTMQKNSQP